MHFPYPLGGVLIVDDDRTVAELLSENLRSEGYLVRVIPTTAAVCATDLADMVLMLVDGARQQPTACELIARVRALPGGARLGIIFYSDYDDERAAVDALDAGADDCVCKPFSLRELLARVRAVMRRRQASHSIGADTVLHYKDLSIDLMRHEVLVGGRPVGLTPTEQTLLELLLRNRDGYTSRGEIFREVWPDGATVNERIVDTNISRLRCKLGELGACIANRTGLGYCLD